MILRTFILGVMRGVGKMGGSRWDTSSCPIDLKFLQVITINLRNSETEWAELNPQSAFLQTGLVIVKYEKEQEAKFGKYKRVVIMKYEKELEAKFGKYEWAVIMKYAKELKAKFGKYERIIIMKDEREL